jgi:hypothetical protein
LCQGTSRPHYGRGLCRACHQRLRRRGTISSFPTIRNKRII